MIETEPMDTIHIYYERNEPPKEKQPEMLILLFSSLIFLATVIFCAMQPNAPLTRQKTLIIPASFFSVKFTQSETIIPTGTHLYPATSAQGTLTLYNGSILSQTLPRGLIFTGKDGTEVVTDEAVFVPAGNAPFYGMARVSGHALSGGARGNIASGDIDNVLGTSLYVKNVDRFRGGADAYSVPYATQQDKTVALSSARDMLNGKTSQYPAILSSCHEQLVQKNLALQVMWLCQYARIPHLHFLHIRLVGKNLYVEVMFVAQPHILIPK